ncbi:hypothetical protein R1T16_14000 [Flavobacterium sp. DG1-102-2]|uniref:hypothetical protein n=1 Tax=Flavobacterium sp. DG1-102-2 TaxID=3081663 RepID=UPI002949205B|nr:hypothetical protein [Flavobacterium sp. DG1-102-2]MDV6169544.1 hypothetical protein [Flavobacterium sp. DG1-102-2]
MGQGSGRRPPAGRSSPDIKPLDKRFYFLRPEVMPGAHLIASDLMQDWAAFANIPFETFTGLPFADIRAKYYTPLEDVLDKACIVTAELLLKDTDIINFDFKKRYYIEQLGANFIMNKIINYIPGKPVKCELIKVPDNMFEPFTVKINRVVISSYQVTIYYETTDTITGVIVEYDPGNNAWISLPFAGTSPVTFNLERGSYKLQLRAKGKLSNNVTINIPDVRTINSI